VIVGRIHLLQKAFSSPGILNPWLMLFHNSFTIAMDARNYEGNQSDRSSVGSSGKNKDATTTTALEIG
jgi:hypothetical protein